MSLCLYSSQHTYAGTQKGTTLSIVLQSIAMKLVLASCSMEDVLGEEVMTHVKKVRLLQRKGGEMDPKKVLRFRLV